MDENTVAEINNEILEVSNLLWGPTVKADVFRRWAQGKLGSALLFKFSWPGFLIHMNRI